MFTESSGSFCFMGGVSSNSAVFASDNKDLNMDPPEFGGLLVRPCLKIRKEEEEENQLITLKPLRSLKVEIPSCEGSEKDDSEEGLKTPTSSDQRIPVIPECPGAPKKRKSRATAKKRKDDDCRNQQVVAASDLWQELESMFPNTQLVVDLGAVGKIKRLKRSPAG